MIIVSYLENHDACVRQSTLIGLSYTRVLTDEEQAELNELTEAINKFQDEILNFE